MSTAALQSYIDKWLAARPARRLALPFLQAPQRDVRLALAALEQELLDAAYGIREPQVAMAKLHWWAEELAGAATSGGRHPLTQTLFASDTTRCIAAEHWLAPILAALAQLDSGTPADFAAQLQMAESFHGALAALETRGWFGADADPARAAHMATLDHLLQATTHLQENAAGERLPLPMARLARHHLDREGLLHDSPARRDAVRAQLADIASSWRDASQLSGPLTAFRGLDARLGMRWTQRAAKAADPLAKLRAMQARQTGPGMLMHAWSAARACRRIEMAR